MQPVEFFMPPHIGPVTISAGDARRLIDDIRQVDPNDNAARKIEEATQLHNSARVKLAIGEDEIVLAALDRLEQTGDFLNPLRRLQRDLRAKISAEGG